MRRSYALVAGAIVSGGILMGLLSQPGISFRTQPELRYTALALALIAVGCQGLLLRFAARNPAERQVYLWAVGVVLLSWLVAFFSSPSGSSGGMTRLAMRLFHLPRSEAENVVFWTRKCIHFTFYGTLSWFSFRWLTASGLAVKAAVVAALGIALVHACYDEGRQSLFPDRTSSARDVLLDMAGAAVFVGSAANRRREQ